ncbi:MAG: hypothetical protein OXS29_12680 [bacterium]|nr:hypothetical protein [bacterium]MDE0439299.1 hypothetical protein [bacterium]
MSYRFESDPRSREREAGPRNPRRKLHHRPPRLRVTPWVVWLLVSLLGTSIAVAAALTAGEVGRTGDQAFQRAVGGILAVLVFSLPGFALFQLGRFRERTRWQERWWRPTILARLSLLASVVGALLCGYLIAVRIAREWSL